MSERCGKCGSDRVVPRAEIWDRTKPYKGGALYAYVYAKPDAVFFGDPSYATLHARVCGECGFAEIYADGAADLYDAYRHGLSGEAPPVPAAPPEPVPEEACLSCGKTIPAAAKACPACRWTWDTEAASAG